MKTDICKCGELKDRRSKLCRKCTNIERANKPCKCCGKQMPEIILSKNGQYRRKGYCNECEAKKSKEYRERYPEKVKQRRKTYKEKHYDRIKRSYMRNNWRKLGLDPDEMEKRLSNHNGLCEICGQPPSHFKELSTDHCHKTKMFRGFLCHKCNFAIGQFQDNPELLVRAAEYLRTFRSNPGVQTIGIRK